MVCEASAKERVKFALGWMLVVGVLAVIVSACDGGAKGSGDTDPPPPPPPPTYDYIEQEWNDELGTAHFLTVLPISSQEDLLGSFTPPLDIDCYEFFIDPALGATSIWFNFMLECDPFISTKVKLWQTIVNEQGIFSGYQNLGTWVASDGLLIVVDEEIPYDEFYNNDLFIEIIPWNGPADPPPSTDLTYILDFWNS